MSAIKILSFTLTAFVLTAFILPLQTKAPSILSVMPEESAPHEGTWLQWPHHYTYGISYRNQVEPTWVAMTRALARSEKVHIIAYNSVEKNRIINRLTAAGVSLAKVDFLIRRTDDVWVRDNGPIFVYDTNDRLKITDWGFNGWGFDAPYRLDDTAPAGVANRLALPRVNLNATILEGGAIEVDGEGVLMATRSSILEPRRNPGISQSMMESILTKNLGAEKFIWLDGASGGQLDITDTHIDGFARFGPPGAIVTMSEADLAYWGISNQDINTLRNATDINNVPYSFVELPLTANDVVTTYGYKIRFKGSYVNYYVGNTVVLMPTYKDPNDSVAMTILQQLYPDRKVIGIDVRNLYRWGGMVHCVTQQQPQELP
jgi:agmatine deiminase